MSGSSRGQTATIGIILLFGIVAIGSMSILLVAGETVSDVEQNAATEHVTQGFVELSSELETVTYSSDTAKTLDMAVGEEGAVRKENTGWINVSTSEFEKSIPLGSLVYESEAGATIAYQAGGVWRGTGTGAQMISAPPVHYQNKTLTLPVNNVTGDSEITTGDVTVDHREAITYERSSVENEVVTLEITSEYYLGWKEYFVSATNDAVVDSVDDGTNTVTIKLGNQKIDDSPLEKAIVAKEVTVGNGNNGGGNGNNGGGNDNNGGGNDNNGGGNDNNGGGNDNNGGGATISGPIVTGDCSQFSDCEEYDEEEHSYPELDDEIAALIRDKRANATHIETVGGKSLDERVYYLDEDDTMSSNADVDLGNGDVILLLDGDLTITGANINITNTTGNSDATLRMYTNESIALGKGGAGINAGGNPADVQIYGTSTTKISVGQGNSEIIGSIFAPRESPADGSNTAATTQSQIPDCENHDVCLGTGSPTITGSVTAGSVSVTQGSSVSYGADVTENDLTLRTGTSVFPPDITYLNVVEHDIAISEG